MRWAATVKKRREVAHVAKQRTTRFGFRPAHKPSRSLSPVMRLIIVPVRNTVLFPSVVAPESPSPRPKIDRRRAAGPCASSGRSEIFSAAKPPTSRIPVPMISIASVTVANIVRYITGPDETHHNHLPGAWPARPAFLTSFPGTPISPAARGSAYSRARDHFSGDRGTIPEPANGKPSKRFNCFRKCRRSSSPYFSQPLSPAALADLTTSYMDHQAAREAGDPGDDRPLAANGEGVTLSSRRAVGSASG